MSPVAAQLVNNTRTACDRILSEYPAYAMVINEMKADLETYPSAKHAQVVLNALMDITKGEYEL